VLTCPPIRFLILLLAALPCALLSAATLVVNEYWNGSGNPAGATKMNSDEYIEFVLGERATAAQLAQLSFGDSNDNGNSLRSVFRLDEATLNQALLSAGRSDFLPGTIIVVKGAGLGAQQLSYNPLITNATDDTAWAIQLVAGQGAKDHSETLINGTLMIGNSGELVWVSEDSPPANNTDTSGLISALGHGSSTGAVAAAAVTEFGSGVIYTGAVASGTAVRNTGSITSPVAATSATGSRGEVNGGANTLSIHALRLNGFVAVSPTPEPSRTLLLAVGAVILVLRRNRSAPRGTAHD
jgi:hypothetical protein